jgi:hypothetical protein
LALFSIPTDYDLEKLKILRILRVLRPLRLISRNQGLKLAINSFLLSFPSIGNLLIVCSIFFLLFGIVGVSVFKGMIKKKYYFFNYFPFNIKK